jgi:hypothetical protein
MATGNGSKAGPCGGGSLERRLTGLRAARHADRRSKSIEATS